MSRPFASSARAFTRTSNAVSVPRRAIRLARRSSEVVFILLLAVGVHTRKLRHWQSHGSTRFRTRFPILSGPRYSFASALPAPRCRSLEMPRLRYGDGETSGEAELPSAAAFCEFPSAAALLAAQRAFIAAASCARRSGERLSFFFSFLAGLGFCAPAVFAGCCVVAGRFFF